LLRSFRGENMMIDCEMTRGRFRWQVSAFTERLRARVMVAHLANPEDAGGLSVATVSGEVGRCLTPDEWERCVVKASYTT
jgi:hypothetical protein